MFELYTKAFWVATSERAIKSFVQGLIAGVGGGTVLNLWTLDYKTVGSAGLSMMVLSVFTSVISAKVGNGGSPSFGGAEVLSEQAVAVETPEGDVVAGEGGDLPEGTPVEVTPEEEGF